jgi:hypothetical protein
VERDPRHLGGVLDQQLLLKLLPGSWPSCQILQTCLTLFLRRRHCHATQHFNGFEVPGVADPVHFDTDPDNVFHFDTNLNLTI